MEEEFCQIDRTDTNALKWMKFPPDTIPMWVADMDIPTAPEITQALQTRAAHPVYGYTVFSASTKQAICSWAKTRHHWEIQPGWINYAPGVVPAFNVAIHALTVPGDKVAVLVPLYYPMCWAVSENGRRLMRSPLIERTLDDGSLTYEIDYADLEKKFKDPKCRILLFSSPHNPSGRVWTREELTRLADLCQKYDITVISDEIHWDLVLPSCPHPHIPFASLSRDASLRTLTCTAPSKSFNISGLGFSYIVAENPSIFRKWSAMASQVGLFLAPTFGVTATEAAYTHGGAWLDRLRAHLQGNYDLVRRFFEQDALRGLVRVCRMEAMFLIWLDFRPLAARLNLKAKLDTRDMSSVDIDHNDGYMEEWLAQGAKVGCNDGCGFGVQGEGFLRMNVGCSRETVQRALEQIKAFILGQL